MKTHKVMTPTVGCSPKSPHPHDLSGRLDPPASNELSLKFLGAFGDSDPNSVGSGPTIHRSKPGPSAAPVVLPVKPSQPLR